MQTLRRLCRPIGALALAALVALAPGASAQGPAAPGKVLAIEGKVLDIVGLERGVQGALADLGAKVSEKEIRIALEGDVLFDFDSAELRPEALATLEKVAEVMRQHADAPVVIEGHTDSKGKESYNQALSERRAKSVRAWFVEQAGLDGTRIATKGWGEARPVAANERADGSDDPEGRQQNRRVEIAIKTGG